MLGRVNVYMRPLPEDSAMSGVKGMRKLDVENWVNTAALLDKIMGVPRNPTCCIRACGNR